MAAFTDGSKMECVVGAEFRWQLVEDFSRELTSSSVQFVITLIFVPGHRNIYGSERADELARCGSAQNVYHSVDMGASLREIKAELCKFTTRKLNRGEAFFKRSYRFS